MEEKERYIFGQRILYDNEKEVVCFDGFNLDEFMGIITNILNKQDKENKQLKQQLLEYQEQSIRDNQNWIAETTELQQQLHNLPNKIVENTKLKIEKLYLELLLTRLQWIHKRADDCRLEKERFGGIEDMALDSVWRVFDLQHHECANYEEMCELDEGIRCIAEDNLLRDMEHNLQFNVSKSEDEIFEEIRNLQTILKKYGGENE